MVFLPPVTWWRDCKLCHRLPEKLMPLGIMGSQRKANLRHPSVSHCNRERGSLIDPPSWREICPPVRYCSLARGWNKYLLETKFAPIFCILRQNATLFMRETLQQEMKFVRFWITYICYKVSANMFYKVCLFCYKVSAMRMCSWAKNLMKTSIRKMMKTYLVLD